MGTKFSSTRRYIVRERLARLFYGALGVAMVLGVPTAGVVLVVKEGWWGVFVIVAATVLGLLGSELEKSKRYRSAARQNP